jgi:GNAT superfamily N-acetyltransferase
MSDMRIVDSFELTPNQLSIFYDEILAPSFGEEELVERGEMLDALADRTSLTRGRIAIDESGEIVGGIVGDWFADGRVMLLSYLAARPGLRGRGIGKRLLADAVPVWMSDFDAVLTVAEVENPDFYENDEGHGDPKARLKLYARIGAKILRMPYFQPALSAEQSRVRNLFLMVFKADPSVMMGQDRVDAVPLRRFIEEYLSSTEGAVDDDEVRAVRAALQTENGIELADPAEYL